MITLSNSILTANIKSLGAELCSLTDQNNKEYIWEGNPNFWGKHSPILFPIVGTLKNNCYQLNGKKYTLPRHGFAREMDFKLLDQVQNSVTFSLRSSKETLKLFPFDFELQLIYTIVDASLIIEYKVVNSGDNKMPFAIGAHPAFALPNEFTNYSLAFEKEEPLKYHLLENDLISDVTKKIIHHDKQVALNYTLFENDALIFKKLRSNSVTILENQKPFLKVNFEDFPSLGIWTKVNAPFICIEPWFGYSDTVKSTGNLFDKEGIQILNAAETFKSKFSIEILN
jgi:galactose mutarotase-like enzyme